MTRLLLLLSYAIACLLTSNRLSGQQAVLRGQVVLVDEYGGSSPAANVEVAVRDAGGRGAGGSDVTDGKGEFRISRGQTLQPGVEIVVSVSKQGWAIWEPLEGKTPVPQGLLTIRLLPKGSKKFWTDNFIQTFIEDAVEKAMLQVRLSDQQDRQKPVEFGLIIKEWAVKYGFSPEEARGQIDKWIAEVQAAQEDFYKLGLAAFAEHNFRKAGELFNEAGETSEQQLAAVRKQEAELKSRRLQLIEETVRDYRRAGDSRYSDYAFTEALGAYQKALSFVERGQIPELWAAVQDDIGRATEAIGTRAEGPDVQQYLARAVTAFRAALEVYTPEQLPQQWATTQNNLGIALVDQGTRTGGEVSVRLLVQGVTAFRAALGAITRAQSPQQWAMTQDNLGTALLQQGHRTGGEEGRQLLAQAVTAYRAALEVRTREQLPQDWAMTQNNLGIVLVQQGTRMGGEESRQLLAQAVTAYRAALEVQTREQLPQHWAMTQNNLGGALAEQGTRTSGEEGRRLLAQAVTAHRAALEVFTRAHLPQPWAMTQNNLGAALKDQGTRTSGEEGGQLLAQAVTAYRAALEVYTREQLPPQWAITQNNLGIALTELGARTGGEDGRQLLAQAVTAGRAALEVRTREHLPQDWAETQSNLGNALRNQGTRTGGEDGRQLLAQAVTAYQDALTVWTPESRPPQWVQTHINLVRTYLALAQWADAAKSLTNVLRIYSDSEETYSLLADLYHNRMFDFQAAYDLHLVWLQRHGDDVSARDNGAEAAFTVGRFADAEAQVAKILGSAKLSADSQMVMRALEMAALLAQRKGEMIPEKMQELIDLVSAQPANFQVRWGFAGTEQFIRTDNRLASVRDWLLSLFEALNGRGRAALLARLQSAASSFTAAHKP